MGLILLILVILLLFGAVGQGPNWGYAPSGGIGIILVIILILVLLGHLPMY